MKQFWVDVRPWRKEIATAALESGADGMLLPKGLTNKVKELGLITTISEDGDLKLQKDVFEIEITGKSDELKAAKIGKGKIVIIKTKDWTIIPLENLVAQSDRIFAEVKNAEEAKVAFGILEKGVAGVVLKTNNINDIKEVAKMIKLELLKFPLVEAEIINIKPVGMGDRVCVDTCTSMTIGEGMLVGNSSSGMFLVHSESVENPYVEARPFRVNAGGIHAYTQVAGGKTKYLSELKSGDNVIVVNHKGDSQQAIVGRVKIEKRPMMLVEAKHENQIVSLIMQNAETIRLTKKDGSPISIVKLKEGHKVLAYFESAGRHFGMKIKETIKEK